MSSCVGCGKQVYHSPEITSAIEANLQEIHALRSRCASLRNGLHDDIEVGENIVVSSGWYEQGLIHDEAYISQQKQIYFQRMKRTLRHKMIELIQSLDSSKFLYSQPV